MFSAALGWLWSLQGSRERGAGVHSSTAAAGSPQNQTDSEDANPPKPSMRRARTRSSAPSAAVPGTQTHTDTAAAVGSPAVVADEGPAAKKLRRSPRLAAHNASEAAFAVPTPAPEIPRRVTRLQARLAAGSAALNATATTPPPPRKARRTGSSKRSQIAVTCGICLEPLPASSMVYAVLGPHTAIDSSAAAGATPPCAHSFCVDCMRQYVRTGVQVCATIGM